MNLLEEYEQLIMAQNRCDDPVFEERYLNALDKLYKKMTPAERSEAQAIVNKHLDD